MELRGLAGGGPDPEQLLRQVPALVDAPVHGHEALESRLVPDVGVVEAGVQHDHGEGQYVARVCTRQSWGDDWAHGPLGPRSSSHPHPQLPPPLGPWGLGPYLWTGKPQGCTSSSAGQRPPSCGRSSGLLQGGGSSRGTACGRDEPRVDARTGGAKPLSALSAHGKNWPMKAPHLWPA